MKYNVEMMFTYSNANGTEVIGRLTMPFINGIAYRPFNVSILSGTLDYSHNQNTGENSKKLRLWKNNTIENYCIKKGSVAEIVKPFFIKEGKSIGLVSVISRLNGFNSNRTGALYIRNHQIEKYKAAQLFQNLKDFREVNNEYIELEKALSLYKDYFKNLIANYSKNKETSSANRLDRKGEKTHVKK